MGFGSSTTVCKSGKSFKTQELCKNVLGMPRETSISFIKGGLVKQSKKSFLAHHYFLIWNTYTFFFPSLPWVVQIPCQFKRVQLTHNCGEDNEMISVWCKNCDKMCRWGALNIDSDGQRLPGGDNGRAKPGRKGKKASGSMGMLEVGE